MPPNFPGPARLTALVSARRFICYAGLCNRSSEGDLLITDHPNPVRASTDPLNAPDQGGGGAGGVKKAGIQGEKHCCETLVPSFHPSASITTMINLPRELSREPPRGRKQVEGGTEGEGFQPREPRPQQHIIKTASRIYISANGRMEQPLSSLGDTEILKFYPVSSCPLPGRYHPPRAGTPRLIGHLGCLNAGEKVPTAKTDLFIESNLFIKTDSVMNPRIYYDDRGEKSETSHKNQTLKRRRTPAQRDDGVTQPSAAAITRKAT